MKKFLLVAVSLLVGFGAGYALPHKASDKIGGFYETNVQHMYGGIYSGNNDQFAVDTSGNVTTTGTLTSGAHTASAYKTATVGASSSSPAALGSAASGHFIVAAGATTANASTTIVTANSDVAVQLEQTTPIAGTTCNTAVNASSTPAVKVIASNGFIVTIPSAPVTNPFCYSYSVTN